MPTQTLIFFNKFVGHLKYMEKTRTKLEKLKSQRIIVKRDIEQIYSGLFLDVICSFEDFIENLFIGLLVGRLIHSSPNIIPRVNFKSDRVARDVVLGGMNYVDWFPYRLTEKRAKAFFRRGLPFTMLDRNDKEKLENILYIRNAIAHKSTHAMRMFEIKVIGSQILMPRERTPSGYLRGIFRISPIQSRYENLIAEISRIAMKLCI